MSSSSNSPPPPFSRGAAALALLLVLSVAGRASALVQQVVDLPAEDTPLSADFEEVRRIGDPDVLLTAVEAAAFGDDGRLYVLDADGAGQRLLVFGDDGAVREIGRQGQGPGEYSAISHFAPTEGGGVAAFDVDRNRYLVFDRDGDFERFVAMPSGLPGGAGTFDFGRDARPARRGDDLISVRHMEMDMSRAEEGRVGASPSRRIVERLGLGGKIATLDTVMRLWTPPPPPPSERNVDGIAVSMAMRMFEPRIRYDVSSSGAVVVADSTAYAVKVAGSAGVERVLRRPLDAVPVTRRVRNRVKDAHREALARELATAAGPVRAMLEESRPALEESIDEVQFYDEISVIADIAAGWERTVWVVRIDADEPWNEEISGPVDVLVRDGGYVGTFAAGSDAMPLALGPDGLAAYVETDAFEVQTVVIKRLPAELR